MTAKPQSGIEVILEQITVVLNVYPPGSPRKAYRRVKVNFRPQYEAVGVLDENGISYAIDLEATDLGIGEE